MQNAKVGLFGAVLAAAAIPTLLTGCTNPNVFANCAAMHAKYPHGVGRIGAVDRVTSGRPVTNFYVSTTIYNVNTKLDRDRDGVACEAH